MELLHFNIWWSVGVAFINNGFTYDQGLELYRKGIQYVDDMWNNVQRNFQTWENAQSKFNLTQTEFGEWTLITNTFFDKWRHLLDEDTDTTHPGQWIGLYVGEEEDPAFVVQCTNEFVLLQWQLQRVTLHLPAQCFTVGTYSRCLNEWEKPSGTIEGCFYEIKIIQTTRWPKDVNEEDILTITFFYEKTATLRWD